MQGKAVHGGGHHPERIVMHNANQLPCADCQKALHRHTALSYLYCGHHRVIAFRIPAQPPVFLAVTSTAEAMQVIRNAARVTPLAESA